MQIIKLDSGRMFFQAPGGHGFPLGPEDPHLADCVQRAFLVGRTLPYQRAIKSPIVLGAGGLAGVSPGLLLEPGSWDLTPLEAVKLFLKHLAKRVKPRTYEIRKNDLLGGKGLVGRFGGDEWGPWLGFWAWIDGDAWREYRTNTIKSFIASAKGLIAFCTKAKIHIPNFADGARDKITTRQKEEAPHLLEEEWVPMEPTLLRDILEFAAKRWSDQYPIALQGMILHGINPVDIFAMDWKFIEEDRDGLGTFYSNRRCKTFELLDIPLADPFARNLLAMRKGKTDGHIFVQMPQTNPGLDRRLAIIRRELHIPKQPRGQNGSLRLRHSFASIVDDLVLPEGRTVERKYVRRLMGHKKTGGQDAEMLDVYTKAGDIHTKKIVAALVNHIEGA